jgi:collagenase-like PrtC family protease
MTRAKVDAVIVSDLGVVSVIARDRKFHSSFHSSQLFERRGRQL